MGKVKFNSFHLVQQHGILNICLSLSSWKPGRSSSNKVFRQQQGMSQNRLLLPYNDTSAISGARGETLKSRPYQNLNDGQMKARKG